MGQQNRRRRTAPGAGSTGGQAKQRKSKGTDHLVKGREPLSRRAEKEKATAARKTFLLPSNRETKLAKSGSTPPAEGHVPRDSGLIKKEGIEEKGPGARRFDSGTISVEKEALCRIGWGGVPKRLTMTPEGIKRKKSARRKRERIWKGQGPNNQKARRI